MEFKSESIDSFLEVPNRMASDLKGSESQFSYGKTKNANQRDRLQDGQCLKPMVLDEIDM